MNHRSFLYLLLFLCSSLLCGCFINIPIYYDTENTIITPKSLHDFQDFAVQKNIRYKSSLGSLRQSGAVSSSFVVLDSYGDIFDDQIPGKSGIEVEKANYQPLPNDFFGALTQQRPVQIKGRIMHNSSKAIILIHGFFFSKRTFFLKEFCDMAEKQGFSVITIDLRGHGENMSSEMSAGIYEALDVCYLAKRLKKDYDIDYIGLLGFSLGAHTAIRALYEASWEAEKSGEPACIDAGVAISPPFDMHRAFLELGTPGFGKPTNNFFYGLFQERMAALYQYGFVSPQQKIHTFNDYIDHIILPYYKNNNTMQMSVSDQNLLQLRKQIYQNDYKFLDQKTRMYEQMFQQMQGYNDFLNAASTINLVSQIKQPLCIIHPKDDTVISIAELYKITQEINRKKQHNILVVTVPDGGHIALQHVDPNWTYNVVYGFHYYHAYPNNRDSFQQIDKVHWLWYYLDRGIYPTQLRLLWTLF